MSNTSLFAAQMVSAFRRADADANDRRTPRRRLHLSRTRRATLPAPRSSRTALPVPGTPVGAVPRFAAGHSPA